MRLDLMWVVLPWVAFDGVACFFSIFDVPRRYHLGILRRLRRVLKPRGFLAIHMGWGDWVGVEENWLGGGAPMYWSHFGRGRNIELIKKAKFHIILSRASRQKDGTHLLVLAQR